MSVKTIKRKKGKAYFGLQVDLNRRASELLKETTNEQLEETLNAYLTIMKESTEPTEDDPKTTVEVDKNILAQMGLFSSITISGHLAKRHRGANQ